jgi:hypothetical protein
MSTPLETLISEINAYAVEWAVEEKQRSRRRNAIKKELVAIYQDNNPEKIKDVSSLLKKYDIKEDTLLQVVQKKYRVPSRERERGYYSIAGAPEKWSYVQKDFSVGPQARRPKVPDGRWNKVLKI